MLNTLLGAGRTPGDETVAAAGPRNPGGSARLVLAATAAATEAAEAGCGKEGAATTTGADAGGGLTGPTIAGGSETAAGVTTLGAAGVADTDSSAAAATCNAAGTGPFPTIKCCEEITE